MYVDDTLYVTQFLLYSISSDGCCKVYKYYYGCVIYIEYYTKNGFDSYMPGFLCGYV